MRTWTFEELENLIRATVDELKCPPKKLKGYDIEDIQAIRDEENGYHIAADTIIRKLSRECDPSGA
jgi:hypothetical protein